MKILVTGGTGFVGQSVVKHLLEEGYPLRAALRREQSLPAGVEGVVVGELGPSTQWERALEGVECVVHCAARAHVLREHEVDPRSAFMRINAEGTERLVKEAVRAGVERFIHISSVAVYGLNRHPLPIGEDQPLRPRTPYGESKMLAERSVAEAYGPRGAGSRPGRGWVCLRPPLIYGAGAPGNLQRLSKAIQRGWPLPFAGISNRRSLLGREHLSRVIAALVAAPKLPDRCLNVADHEVVSTAQIIQALGEGVGRPARLFRFPVGLMRSAASFTGRMSTYEQLCESLTFDTGRLLSRVGDLQPQSTVEGLRASGAGA